MHRADYAVKPDRSSAVFVNPSPHKGEVLVRNLAAARPDVPFLFVVNQAGSANKGGQQRSNGNIRYIGPLDDMRQVYRHAKLALMPSQWLETWGRVATEAQFSGIPVLASNRGGLPEAVGPGGICLAVDAPLDAWLAAFSAIWDREDNYGMLSERALLFAQRSEIDPDAIVDAFQVYLKDLLGRGRVVPHRTTRATV
jgi:glycosyltransferase involved in cell wall biosynthesis